MSDNHPNQGGGPQIVVPAIANGAIPFPVSSTVPGNVPDSIRLTSIGDYRRNHLSQEVLAIEDGMVSLGHGFKEGTYVVSTDTPGFDPGLIYLLSVINSLTGSMPIIGNPPHGS